MSSTFDTSYGQGDLVLPSHIKQYSQPINDLESGAGLFRQATDSSGSYLVDFRASANPGGHAIDTLTQGQVITFKASHDSPAAATLSVETEQGTVSNVPIHLGDQQMGAAQIKTDQMVSVVYNNTTTPRFDVMGVQADISLDDLAGTSVSSPATGEILIHDGTQFVNDQAEISNVNGLSAALASAGGTPTGHLAEVQGLTLTEGDLLMANSSGQITKIDSGTDGQILKMFSGEPTWIDDVGGGSPGLLTNGMVAYGYRYENITSTSDALKTSAFTPESGATYLVRYLSNHSTSVGQLDLAGARTATLDHFCRAEETGSSTTHNIGFSSSGANDYTGVLRERCRSIDFLWTAGTTNEVEIVLGQPSLTYGEFTGTLHVYKLRPEVTVLGWGAYPYGYSWLEDATNVGSTVGSGAYKTGVSLDATKTYCFVGRWTYGYSVCLCLKQGSSYWRLPVDSDAFATTTSGQAAWSGATYYEAYNIQEKGELVRYFTPPATGTYDIGVNFYDVLNGSFFLIELP